jgi:hypothetical protein
MKEELIDEWYAVQYSDEGADDWFTWSEHYHTPEAAFKRIAEVQGLPAWKLTDLRVVHYKQTETVVSPTGR